MDDSQRGIAAIAGGSDKLGLDLRHGFVEEGFGDLALFEMESILQDGHASGDSLEPLGKSLGLFFVESLEDKITQPLGAHQQRSFCMHLAFTDPDLPDRIHRFREDLKIETRLPECFQPPRWLEQRLGHGKSIMEIVFTEHLSPNSHSA